MKKLFALMVATILLTSRFGSVEAPLVESEGTMANIPQVNVGGIVYNLKDTEARGQISDLKSALSYHDSGVFINAHPTSATGVSLTWIDNETVTLSGTSSSNTFANLVEKSLSDLGVSPGDTLIMNIETISGSGSPHYRMFWYDGGSSYAGQIDRDYTDIFVIPANTTKLTFRLQLPVGTWNMTIRISLQKRGDNPKYPNDWYAPISQVSVTNGEDLNDYVENGVWLLPSGTGVSYENYPFSGAIGLLNVFKTGNVVTQLCYKVSAGDIVIARRWRLLSNAWRDWVMTSYPSDTVISRSMGYGERESETIDVNNLLGNQIRLLNDSHEYENKPVGMTLGFVAVFFTGQWHLQLAWQFSGGKMWKRRGNAAGSAWENWVEISGGDNTYNVTNNYSFPGYSQSVTLTATPTITSDTNNYLAPTGDTTDRTADILAMLTATGICRLGVGNYYVNNLQMPAGSSIIGSGFGTRIRLAGTADGYAIKMGSRCLVQDLRLDGADSDISVGETEGGRHGILWQGDYTQQQTAPDRSMISNIWIYNFTGGGITCYDTGYGTSNALEVTNAYIFLCWAGVNISYWSEFHKFTNVRAGGCRIGCVNNGGNNVFVNCDFSSNLEIAMLMDNSQGQSPNNTHGSCIGCVFNHTQHAGESNAGIGIEILNCHSGFIFSGCQIFYSQIHLVDSDGIVISDTNFGNRNCDVNISGGGAVLFSGCMVEGAIPITIDNNQNVHFANCYNKTTGATWGN